MRLLELRNGQNRNYYQRLGFRVWGLGDYGGSKPKLLEVSISRVPGLYP